MSADKGVARSIQLVCQDCSGNLRTVGQDREGKPRFDCTCCKARFVYTDTGWDRLRGRARG